MNTPDSQTRPALANAAGPQPGPDIWPVPLGGTDPTRGGPAELRRFTAEPAERDTSPMFVLDAFGVSLLIHLRPDGSPFVHVDGTQARKLPVLLSVNHGPETAIGTDTGEEEDSEDDERPTSLCGCGFTLIYTGEGWQHEAAPWFWGDDHDPDPGPDGEAAAAAYNARHHA